MTTELVVRERVELVRLDAEQIKFLAHTEFVPERIRGNLPAIFATIATGREIGIGDMAALRHVHMIDGKPGYSTEIMAARVHAEGHTLEGEVDGEKAIARGCRSDTGAAMTFTYTLAMAEQAGLLGKQNWRKHPQSMLWARAAGQLCRMLFPDCMSGATYTAEELEDSAGEPQASQDASTSSVSQADPYSELASPAEEVLGPPSPPDPGVNPTQKQIKYLNLTVGPMDQATKRRVWATVALMRVRDTDALILELGGVDGAGVLHWSPLRDTLTKREAHELIEKLEALEKQRQAEDAA